MGTLHKDGRFESSVTREKMDEIIQMLESCQYVKAITDGWVEEEDVFLMDRGKSIRCRLNYEQDTMSVSTDVIPILSSSQLSFFLTLYRRTLSANLLIARGEDTRESCVSSYDFSRCQKAALRSPDICWDMYTFFCDRGTFER